jgi:hypothetical protein
MMGDLIRMVPPLSAPKVTDSDNAAAGAAWERYCALMRPLVDDPALLFDRARTVAALKAEHAFRAAFLRLEVATVLQRDQ